MQNILKELCEGGYAPKIDIHNMNKEDAAVWERTREILGDDAIDQLLYSQCETDQETYFDYFRQGFRLGALLMLELMRPE